MIEEARNRNLTLIYCPITEPIVITSAKVVRVYVLLHCDHQRIGDCCDERRYAGIAEKGKLIMFSLRNICDKNNKDEDVSMKEQLNHK